MGRDRLATLQPDPNDRYLGGPFLLMVTRRASVADSITAWPAALSMGGSPSCALPARVLVRVVLVRSVLVCAVLVRTDLVGEVLDRVLACGVVVREALVGEVSVCGRVRGAGCARLVEGVHGGGLRRRCGRRGCLIDRGRTGVPAVRCRAIRVLKGGCPRVILGCGLLHQRHGSCGGGAEQAQYEKYPLLSSLG